MGEKVQVRIILEVLGRPKEEVMRALYLLIENIGKEPGIHVIGSDVHEPVVVKDAKDLFTAFAEVTFEAQTIEHLFGILFAYMPANVEILQPSDFLFTNASFNHFANVLLSRLHNYDAISKKLLNEKQYLTQELYKVAPHLFKKKEQAQPTQQQEQKKEKGKKSKRRTKK